MPEETSGADALTDNPLPPEPTPAEPVAANAHPVTSEPPPAPQIPTPAVDPGYTAGGVPTFDSVREKIETRYGTSLGAAELDAETPEGRSAEEQYEARHKAAAERLAQIRASMHNQEQDDA
jgi:hypothetical protein